MPHLGPVPRVYLYYIQKYFLIKNWTSKHFSSQAFWIKDTQAGKKNIKLEDFLNKKQTTRKQRKGKTEERVSLNQNVSYQWTHNYQGPESFKSWAWNEETQ